MKLENFTIVEYISICSGIITIISFIKSFIKRAKEQAPQFRSKPYLYRLKIGNILLPIFVLLTGLFISQLFLGEVSVILKISWGVSFLTTVYLVIIANKSFSETKVIEPEWFWRLFFNQIPTRFEESQDTKIKALIVYADDCKTQVEEILKEQNIEGSPLEILSFKVDQFSYNDFGKVLNDEIFGIYILYSEKLAECDWGLDFCEEWANVHKDRPVVYTNFSKIKNVRIHFGKVSNKQYKHGVLRLFERTYQRAYLWEKQSINYRRICVVLILISLIGYMICFNFNKEQKIYINDLEQEKFKMETILEKISEIESLDKIKAIINEVCSYNKDFSMKNSGYEYVDNLKEVFENSIQAGTLANNSFFQYHARKTLRTICNVNCIDYEVLSSNARLTYWKKGKDGRVHRIISNLDEKEKTSFPVTDKSIIGGAFNHPDNFICFLKDSIGNNGIYKAITIIIENDEEKVNQELAENIEFSYDPRKSENVTAIIGYCLDDEIEKNTRYEDELTGVCLEIRQYQNVSFMEERITRAILRRSLQEIHMYPRSLFFTN